jgi:hypothetical protein
MMLLVPKFPYPEIKRIESDTDGRKYDTPSGILPSVTSILSKTKSAESTKALDNWKEWHGEKEAGRILKESGDIGTLLHKHLESYVKGEERPSGTNIIRIQAKKLADVMIEKGLVNVSEVWGVEVPLYYPSLYGGTTDMAGIHLGEEAIVDFKNSRKMKEEKYVEDYKSQLVAYAEAHNVVYGTNIRKGVIMIVVRGDTKPADFGKYQEFILEGNEYDKYKDEWFRRVEKYYNSNS